MTICHTVPRFMNGCLKIRTFPTGTRACEQRADQYFDEMLDIADNALPEEVQKAKLQIDTRKWVLARMNPVKYGDKTDKDTNTKVIDLMSDFMKELSNKGE